MRYTRRMSRLERRVNPPKDELPRIFVCYGTDRDGFHVSDLPTAVVDALAERCEKGYDRQPKGGHERARDLRREIEADPDPLRRIEAMSDEDFSLAMSAIGYFVGLRSRPEPLQRVHSDLWEAL